MAASHPLPPAPAYAPVQQQQQQPQQQSQQQYQPRPGGRQRTKSTFSFRSQNSQGSGNKVDLIETHQEKENLRLNSKADPTTAMTEEEPAAVANQKTSMAPIRAIQHRDALGNPIAEPDRSNPTRSRWERPLDTIRSFEAAINGDSRKAYTRSDAADNTANYNRRSGYYGGGHQQSYYGGRPQSYRPESTYGNERYHGGGRPDSYYNGADGPSNGYHPNRARHPRAAPEPQYNNGQSIYPAHGNQQSYETVGTASGSGSSDPAGYSTDPSSENSSVDPFAPAPPKDPAETYGFNGFGNVPQFAAPGAALVENQGGTNGANNNAQRQQAYGYQNQGPPPPPSKDNYAPQAPIKLGPTSGNSMPQQAPVRPGTQKRKSWFSKRFSKA